MLNHTLNASRRAVSTKLHRARYTPTTYTTFSNSYLTPGFQKTAFTTTAATAGFFTSVTKKTEQDPVEQEVSPKGSFTTYLTSLGKAESTDNSLFKPEYGTLHDFKEPILNSKDQHENTFDFAKTRGQVVLITNTACQCGFTGKVLPKLIDMQNKYSKEGKFTVVGFSSNSFNQDAKTPAEIHQYLDDHGVNFPVISTSDVNGTNQNPVYAWLKKSFPGQILWNFSTYFLVDHRGVPIARFEKASWEDIDAAIEKAIQNSKNNDEAK